ncbi:hypothetical protein ASF72_00250 [Arthrobacter sp. Leaf141]|uniref:hypothetical protein n=1 Tax=Arthrobacter sp. Leaf141 TaxID=1736273 RepID=UPI0006FB6F72|nr:hypothetical protein [Arthrobacter sp. Leaf141]KQR04878.1 hypothetical protein ASF72_00250 [Arthrobacter sp. Leaf141]
MSAHDGNLRRTVAELLDDSGQQDNEALEAALMSLGGLAHTPAPAPGPGLAALLSDVPDEVARHRRLGRGKSTIVGLAVIAGMGLGATGVAASTGGHAGTGSFSVQQLLGPWVTGPANPAPAPIPDPASVPVPAPAPAPQPGHVTAGEPGGPSGGDSTRQSASTPGSVPAPSPVPPAVADAGADSGAAVPAPAAAAAGAGSLGLPDAVQGNGPGAAGTEAREPAAPALPAPAAPPRAAPAASPPAAASPPGDSPKSAESPGTARKADGTHPRDQRRVKQKDSERLQAPAGKDKPGPGGPRG